MHRNNFEKSSCHEAVRRLDKVLTVYRSCAPGGDPVMELGLVRERDRPKWRTPHQNSHQKARRGLLGIADGNGRAESPVPASRTAGATGDRRDKGLRKEQPLREGLVRREPDAVAWRHNDISGAAEAGKVGATRASLGTRERYQRFAIEA